MIPAINAAQLRLPTRITIRVVQKKIFFAMNPDFVIS